MRQRAEPEEVEVRLSIEEITDLAEIAALERELGMANAE